MTGYYPIDREYEAAHPGKCPVLIPTTSGGFQVCRLALVEDFCPRHSLIRGPLADDVQEVEEVEP